MYCNNNISYNNNSNNVCLYIIIMIELYIIILGILEFFRPPLLV